MIITIDGPAGAGKSTVARRLASRLGVAYLDTGAMYRTIALAALEDGVDLQDRAALIELARHCDIEVSCGARQTRVRLNGRDVSDSIRTMAVNGATNYVARIPEIRAILVEKQRQIGRKLGSLVTEGRDQGSVVFPDATVKFFLDASVEKRAERRYQEMTASGQQVSFGEILKNLSERDGNDRRQWEPLLEPASAVHIDSTEMGLEEVVERLLEEVHANQG